MKIQKTTILFASLLFPLFCSVGCEESSAESEQGFTKEMALARRKVEVAPVQRLDFVQSIESPGSLEARYEAALRALVGGPLVAVHFDIGEQVSADQVLFQTRPVESELALRSAEAALKVAKANLSDLLAWQRSEEVQILAADVARARAEYEKLARDSERAAIVFERGAISESELQAARTAAESARALLEVAEERLRVAETGPTEEQVEIARSQVEESAAAAARARQNLADTQVKAPYAGVVTRRHLKVGDYAGRGDPVLEIADISYLEAETRLPERYAGQIKLKVPVSVKVESLGIEKEGRVIAVSRAVEPATRTFLVKVGLDNADYALKAGVFCTCDFQLPPLEDALAIPNAAVQRQEGSSFVWIAESGRVRQVSVTLGVRNDGYTQVLNGLTGDEQVVVSGAGALSENDEIEIVQSS